MRKMSFWCLKNLLLLYWLNRILRLTLSYNRRSDLTKEHIHETLEFTPKEVAKYLFRKGKTDEFQAILNELVESAEVSPDEAEEYEKAVMEELFNLQQRESEVNADELEVLYPRVFEEDSQSTFPLYNDVQGSIEASYPVYMYGINPARLEDQSDMNTYINYLQNRPVSMGQFVNDWMTQAILSDDQKDKELLADIMDFVSQEKYPNIEDQTKAVLGDIFIEKLKEYFPSKYETQYIETDMQNPAFVERVGYEWTNSLPSDVSKNTKADKKINKLKKEKQINELEKN